MNSVFFLKIHADHVFSDIHPVKFLNLNEHG